MERSTEPVSALSRLLNHPLARPLACPLARPLVSPWPGRVAGFAVAVLVLGTLLAVALRAERGAGFGAADWAALRFTLVQAALSALLSVGLAVPVARALARRRFAGRRVLIALMGAPFILPVIVAILGLLQVFGRSGWLNQLTALAGLPPLQIYGLHGVVLAHVFFNLPLATRLILQAWQEVPPEQFRLAAQLRLEGRAMLRLIELPVLAKSVPGALAVVFAICLSSFAVALTLGGGPRATTLELAIYQAFRFDFDLGRAALLAGVQVLLTLVAGLGVLRLSRGQAQVPGLRRDLRRWDGRGALARVLDVGWIGLAAVFLLVPLAAIIVAGLPGLMALDAPVIRAALSSIVIAACSTVLLLALALPMSWAAALSPRASGVELAGLLGLAASPLVIGTGLFILLRALTNPFALALPVTAAVNALMALPFALRILVPRARDLNARYGRLGQALGMAGWPFASRVLLPQMWPQIGFAAGLGAALSMGDLGVITLFADPERATLPLQIYRLMGAYRMQDAASAAVLLLLLSLGAFWLCDRGGRWHAEL